MLRRMPSRLSYGSNRTHITKIFSDIRLCRLGFGFFPFLYQLWIKCYHFAPGCSFCIILDNNCLKLLIKEGRRLSNWYTACSLSYSNHNCFSYDKRFDSQLWQHPALLLLEHFGVGCFIFLAFERWLKIILVSSIETNATIYGLSWNFNGGHLLRQLLSSWLFIYGGVLSTYACNIRPFYFSLFWWKTTNFRDLKCWNLHKIF